MITAASAIFAEKGFGGAQINEIAAAAEVSLTSIYGMFGGKEDLYQEVITTAAQAVRDAVRKEVEALENPRDQLLGVIDSLFACWEENQDLLRIYARSTHGLPWKIRESMGESSLEIFREFTHWVIGLAERAEQAGCLRGLEPDAVTFSLIGAATTMATRWIENTPERPLTAAAPPVRAVFERLIERPRDA